MLLLEVGGPLLELGNDLRPVAVAKGGTLEVTVVHPLRVAKCALEGVPLLYAGPGDVDVPVLAAKVTAVHHATGASAPGQVAAHTSSVEGERAQALPKAVGQRLVRT